MKINWKVRIKNRAFWVFIIPMTLLLVQQVCGVFGVQLDTAALSDQLVAIVGTLFAILAAVGVVADPTTPGVEDSDRAMTYEEPGKPGQ